MMGYEYDDTNIMLEETPKRKNDVKRKGIPFQVYLIPVVLGALTAVLLPLWASSTRPTVESVYPTILYTSNIQIQMQTTMMETFTTGATSSSISTQTANLNNSMTEVSSFANCFFQWEYSQDTVATQALSDALDGAGVGTQAVEVQTFGELQTCVDSQNQPLNSQSLVMDRTAKIDLRVTDDLQTDPTALGNLLQEVLAILAIQSIANLREVQVTFNGDSTAAWSLTNEQLLAEVAQQTGGEALYQLGLR